ncbi:putative peptide transport permease protein Mb1314c [Arthrobacter sp. Hiyo4]|nr:putative peptide transport permease protein Mb1314c [Arthrobacter sp. Hiyo4]
MWISTRLFLASIVLTLVIGVALGVYSAARQYRFQDRVITSYSYLAYIVPAPIAYFLVQLGAININETVGERIFFVTGISTPGMQPGWAQFVDMVAHYAVPTIAITLVGWGSYQIAQRQYLLDNVNADFVRTARAKGSPGTRPSPGTPSGFPSSRSRKASPSLSRPSSPAASSPRRSSPGPEWGPGALTPSRCRM